MSKLELSIAVDNHDRTRPLIDGDVRIDGVNPVFMLQDPEEVFFRTFRHVDYDIYEFSLSSCSVKTAAGTSSHIAVPVFPSRAFRHSSTYMHVDRGIDRPEGLKGRRVGVSEYQLAANVQVRMFLEEEYGVKASDICWARGGYEDPTHAEKISLKLPEGVALENAPEGKVISNLLAEEEIGGMVRPRTLPCFGRGHPQVKYLFDGPQRNAAEWYERHKLFPIIHTLGVRKTLAEQHPWLPGAMAKVFEHSEEVTLARLSDTSATKVTLSLIENQLHNARRLMGHDFWSYRFANNEHMIDRFLAQYHAEGLSSRRLRPAGLFHLASLESFKI